MAGEDCGVQVEKDVIVNLGEGREVQIFSRLLPGESDSVVSLTKDRRVRVTLPPLRSSETVSVRGSIICHYSPTTDPTLTRYRVVRG